MPAATSATLGPGAWFTIATVLGTLVLLVWDRFAPHRVLLASVVILLLSGVLTPAEAVAGFSNTAILTLGLLFVVVAALRCSGAIDWITRLTLGESAHPWLTLTRLIGLSSSASAFVNNTPLVAILTDSVQQWSRKTGIAPSRLLIPLSYATILGGMCTLIGTSTNLIICALMAEQSGLPVLHLWDPARVGVPILIAGSLYLLTAGRLLLPERPAPQQETSLTPLSTQQHVQRVAIAAPAPLLARTFGALTMPPGSSAASLHLQGPLHSLHGRRPKALLTLFIFIAMIMAVSLFDTPLFVAALGAALAAIATGCLDWQAAEQSVDYALLVMLACALALGTALTKTGVAAALAAWLMGLGGSDPWHTLIMLYLLTVLLTEVITNNATAVLMFPIALACAGQLGVSPMPFIMVIMIAASASFMTPIGYQTNLMVFKPGNYRFGDYFRIGAPLSLVVGVVALSIIPQIWPF